MGKDPPKVCANCLLTKLLGCDIMENSDRGVPSRAAEALERGGDFSPPTYYFISAKNFCNFSTLFFWTFLALCYIYYTTKDGICQPLFTNFLPFLEQNIYNHSC